MAYQTDTVTELLVLAVGNAASPEVFTPYCSFAHGSRGYEIINSLAERLAADCATPANPAKTRRSTISTDWSVSAEGVVNVGDDKTLADWAKAGTSKNVKIYYGSTGAAQLLGPAILERFAVNGGGKGQVVNCSISLKGADAVTITAVA